jgi:transcriptional regulator with PAS, ATPase and Fis domain
MSARREIERLFLTDEMRRVLDAVSDGVMVIDRERRVVFLNRAARRLLDYGDDERLGCRCKEVLNTADCESNCPLTRLMVRGGRVENFEMVYRGRGDRALAASSTFEVIADGDGKVVGAVEVFRDLGDLRRLEAELHGRRGLGRLVGGSRAMRDLYRLVQEVGPTDAAVLVTGEPGTGKELVASALHETSQRAAGPFVRVTCTAMAHRSLESGLFGSASGAPPRAGACRPGCFDEAGGGTLFLDEVGALALPLQARLLGVLQDGELAAAEASGPQRVDVRIVAASSRDLEDAVERGAFLRDLFYRLNVVPIHVPALRERRDDVPELAAYFVRGLNQQMRHRFVDGLAPEALDLLLDYDYPGNVRELETIVEHAFARCRGRLIRLEHLPPSLTARRQAPDAQPPVDQPAAEPGESLDELERDFLLRVLEDNDWRLNVVAERLALSRTTLWRKLKRLGIENRRRGRG